MSKAAHCHALPQAGLADSPWPTPISVPNASFDLESAMVLCVERVEMLGYSDSREIGCSLFSNSPLTMPEPTPPPSPAPGPTSWDHQHPLAPLPPLPPFPPNPLPAHGEAMQTTSWQGEVENVSRRHSHNKRRSHAQRRCNRAEWWKKQEASAHPYEVRHATHQKHVHGLKAVDTHLDLVDISITLPGYISLHDVVELKEAAYVLDDLVGGNSHFKFKLQKWDGR